MIELDLTTVSSYTNDELIEAISTSQSIGTMMNELYKGINKARFVGMHPLKLVDFIQWVGKTMSDHIGRGEWVRTVDAMVEFLTMGQMMSQFIPVEYPHVIGMYISIRTRWDEQMIAAYTELNNRGLRASQIHNYTRK